METKKNNEHYSSKFSDNKKTKNSMWPPCGVGASALLKIKHNVMIGADLLELPCFQKFYLEWLGNYTLNQNKLIQIANFELELATVPHTYDKLRIIKYGGCNDYIDLFKHIKGEGSWIFLTKSQEKAETLIKASKETKTYLRIYGLDEYGKLINYKPISEETYRSQNLSEKETFSLSESIYPIKKRNRISLNIPHSGEKVYTSNKELVILGDEFISNSQSITYQTNIEGIQAKIYQPQWLNISYFEDKIKRMLEIQIKCKGICWPIDLLYDINGEFIGMLVPKAEGYQLKQELLSQQGLSNCFPDWNRKDLTHLTKVILDKIVYLQDRNILFGLINPGAIFVKDSDHVYFTEMDTYQIEGYPILSHERVMQAPELQDVSEELRLYTKQQDNYGIALLIFMILMPGKFPYNKGKNKTISESIKNMSFAFRYGRHIEEHGAREYFGLWRFVWSHLGNDLKQSFYYTFQHDKAFSTPERRKDAHYWLKIIRSLEHELDNPYDKESLKIFPNTFKRFSGSNTIKCIKCGIEHPDFYYKYPEKKICNSCLGQPSQTYFVCKTCNKRYYYDFGTLFKYEKLVEKKDFSMPTHCPYCRSDKRKCVSCNLMFPAYRINDDGMCFDCAKKARERIAKRYYCSCGREIVLTQGEVDFYMKKFGNLPKRCKQCKSSSRSWY